MEKTDEFHNMKFEPVLTTIKDCQNSIQTSEEVVDEKDKLKFLQGLQKIVESFLEETESSLQL